MRHSEKTIEEKLAILEKKYHRRAERLCNEDIPESKFKRWESELDKDIL